MKDTIYFQHDCNAHVDPKIIKLRLKWWREYYWLYRATLEIMREDSDIVLKECDIDANVMRLHFDRNAYIGFLEICVEVWLFIFDQEDKIYYSERLQTNAEYMREKSKKAKASAEARWKKRKRKNANALQTQSERNAIHTYKKEINKEKESDQNNNIERLENYLDSEDTKHWTVPYQILSRFRSLGYEPTQSETLDSFKERTKQTISTYKVKDMEHLKRILVAFETYRKDNDPWKKPNWKSKLVTRLKNDLSYSKPKW